MELLNVNPVFLFIVFSIGFVFGLLSKNLSGWKFIALGFCAIFIYQPLRDAGVAAIAAFFAGILAHHVPVLSDAFSSIREQFFLPRKRAKFEASPNEQSHTKSGGYSSPEEACMDFEDFFRDERGQKRQEGKQEKQHTAQKQSSSQYQKRDEENERLRKENERLKREKEQAEKAQREANESKPDTRTPKEILGLCDGFTQEELRDAYKREVKRWNTSNMTGKSQELKDLAEEEMKKIVGAYETLKQKKK